MLFTEPTENEGFKIGEQLICHNTTIQDLGKSGIYRIVRGNDTTRVNSLPHKVNFLGGWFLVSFLFYGITLSYIFLCPIVDGEDAPEYPSATYQEKKWEHCVNLIKKNEKRGAVVEDTNTRFVVKFPRCELCCNKILNGKDIYTGGDIIIKFS